MKLGLGIYLGSRRASGGVPFKSDLLSLYKASSGDISETVSELDVEILKPCYYFSGNINEQISMVDVNTTIDAYEVEFRIKTSVTTRMGVISLGGLHCVILSGGYIVAGGASILGNSAIAAYNDNQWHTIRIKQTATANVFDIYFDGNLLAKANSGSWRAAGRTKIGSDSSTGLPLIGSLNYIILRNEAGEKINEWRFNEGAFAQYLYDCVGDIDFPLTTVDFRHSLDSDAEYFDSSLVLNDSNNVVSVPYKNGVPRDMSGLLFGSVITEDASGIIPITYGVNFNPNASVDAAYDIFDRNNTTIFNSYAANSEGFKYSVFELDRSLLLSWYNNGYEGKLYPKFLYKNGFPYALSEVLVYDTNYSGENQESILDYTKDNAYACGRDSNDNVLLSLVPKRENVISELYGGLYTRIIATDSRLDTLATVFENHGFRLTAVISNPAYFKNETAYKALWRDLQDRGHDIGLWMEKSQTLIQLYDPDWADNFLALDAEYLGRYDEYGSPLWGIGDVITVGDDVYLGLNSQVRNKVDDITIRPIDGTDTIEIMNIFDTSSLFSSFPILMPNDTVIPESIRGKWVYVGVSDTVLNIFKIYPYEQMSMADFGAGTFTNPLDTEFVTSAGIKDADKVGDDYDASRTQLIANGANERARYYWYYHAKLAFAEMGLDAPVISGELRNITNEFCLSENPLNELGFVAAGVDPIQNGHTFYMNDRHRWSLATLSNNAYADPLDSAYNYKQSINFNNGNSIVYDAATAFTQIVYQSARKRWIVERQVSAYTADDITKWDDLLTLCEANGVNVLTMKDIGTYLFDSYFPTNINPIPDISKDLDSDGIPDGFQALPAGSAWEVSEANGDARSNYGHFIRNSTGVFGTLPVFGGVLPLKTNVSLIAKGKIEDKISISVTPHLQDYKDSTRPDESGVTLNPIILTFTITEDDTWNEIVSNERLVLSRNTSFITIVYSLTKSATVGDVYCGQLFIKR